MAEGSCASDVKPRERAPRQISDSVFAAVLVDDLLKQKIEQNDRKRQYPLQRICIFSMVRKEMEY